MVGGVFRNVREAEMLMEGKKMVQKIVLICLAVSATITICHSLTLSTRGRWILDDASGGRVKMACLNWVSHLEPMVTEGIHAQPLAHIAETVKAMGFNCIRLTYATFMWTRVDYNNKTVAESLDSFNLTLAKQGIAQNNPKLLSLPLIEAYEAVVNELGALGLMIVLDNHVSKPMWCCAREDGNGFFGDTYFDPIEWMDGLTQVATRFKNNPQVVGLSMRNEMRGPRSNTKDWYLYMRQGAEAIHKANPNVLVIVGGLNFDKDLSFLGYEPFGLSLDNKLVFEAHWYSFDFSQQWEQLPPNQACGQRADEFRRDAAFLTTGDNAFPLFISEYGINLQDTSLVETRFFNCFLPTVAEYDLDWALWTLQGSYHYREGKAGTSEAYSVLDFNWTSPRNPQFLDRIFILQNLIEDPNSHTSPYLLLVHAQSGFCVNTKDSGEVFLISCRNNSVNSRWNHGRDGTVIKKWGVDLCLKAVGDGVPPILSDDCSSTRATWKLASDSKLQIAATDEKGNPLCLDGTPSSNSTALLTRPCACLNNEAGCDPLSQWFKFLLSNIP